MKPHLRTGLENLRSKILEYAEKYRLDRHLFEKVFPNKKRPITSVLIFVPSRKNTDAGVKFIVHIERKNVEPEEIRIAFDGIPEEWAKSANRLDDLADDVAREVAIKENKVIIDALTNKGIEEISVKEKLASVDIDKARSQLEKAYYEPNVLVFNPSLEPELLQESGMLLSSDAPNFPSTWKTGKGMYFAGIIRGLDAFRSTELPGKTLVVSSRRYSGGFGRTPLIATFKSSELKDRIRIDLHEQCAVAVTNEAVRKIILIR